MLGPSCQELVRPFLLSVCRVIVDKHLFGHCCQEFFGLLLPRSCRALLPRVYWSIVAKSLSGSCCQEFLRLLLPSICWAAVAKSSSGHCWQIISWDTIGRADIFDRWPTMLAQLFCKSCVGGNTTKIWRIWFLFSKKKIIHSSYE